MFYRYNKGDDYKFAGEVSLEKFTDDNKAIIVNIKDDKQNKSDGWKQDVLKCVNKIEKVEFSLDDVYAFEVELQIMHPDNYHIRDKIRQQLQYIRADGIIEFLGNGKYKKL